VYHTEKPLKNLSVHTHICFIMYSKLLGLYREVSASLKTHVTVRLYRREYFAIKFTVAAIKEPRGAKGR